MSTGFDIGLSQYQVSLIFLECTKCLLSTENNWLLLIMEDIMVKSKENFKEK